MEKPGLSVILCWSIVVVVYAFAVTMFYGRKFVTQSICGKTSYPSSSLPPYLGYRKFNHVTKCELLGNSVLARFVTLAKSKLRTACFTRWIMETCRGSLPTACYINYTHLGWGWVTWQCWAWHKGALYCHSPGLH